jgi:hypothetical protein
VDTRCLDFQFAGGRRHFPRLADPVADDQRVPSMLRPSGVKRALEPGQLTALHHRGRPAMPTNSGSLFSKSPRKRRPRSARDSHRDELP